MSGSDDAPDPTESPGAPRVPRPVRQGPGGRPRPARPSASGGEGGSAEEGEGDEAGRPTPVREAMDARSDGIEPIEPPSLTLEVGGTEWLVRVEGRAEAGFVGDRGVDLLFLTFSRLEEPDTRRLEAIVPGRRLDALGPEALGRALERARPVDDDWSPGGLFPETRRNRRPGR